MNCGDESMITFDHTALWDAASRPQRRSNPKISLSNGNNNQGQVNFPSIHGVSPTKPMGCLGLVQLITQSSQ